MLALVLVGALIAQSAFAAPQAGCIEPCGVSQRQVAGHGRYETKSGWSTHSSWASGGRMNNGRGIASGNLENLDEPNGIVSSGSFGRPGTWHDEKSLVTDDGTGAIDHRASKTVTNNGYEFSSKTSWSRTNQKGTHQPKANSQIISSADFDNQITNIRTEMDRLMREFRIDSNFRVDQGVLDNFKIRSGILENQADLFRNGFDVNSSYHQQAQQMLEKFRRDCEQLERQMQASMNYHTSSSGGQTHGVYNTYYPSTPQYAQPIHAAPTTPNYEERRIQQECNEVQSEMQNFYNKFIGVNYDTFNREDSLNQFKQQADTQMAGLNQKLQNLASEATRHEAERQDLENMISRFQSYQQDLERRVQEAQIKIQQEQRRLQEEIHRKQIEVIQVQEEELRQKLLHIETQKSEAAARERRIQEEKMRLQQVEAEEKLQLEKIERERHELYIKQQQQLAASSVTVAPRPASIIQPVNLGPHVDVKAITDHMTQELHKLQTQVTSFNSYTMQLTVANHHKVKLEAERKAQQLRQNLNNLCEQSNQYHNAQIESSAEQVKRQFEQIFEQFQREAAHMAAQASSSSHASGGYESGSSWQQSGRVSQARQPAITNVDYEHSSQTDVELVQRPQSQRYTRVQPESVDCVEMQAGHPCILPTRSRRDVGAGYGSYSQNTQQRQPENYGYRRNDNEYSGNGLDNNSQQAEAVYIAPDPLRNDASNRQRERGQRGRGFNSLDITKSNPLGDYLAVQQPRIYANPRNSRYSNEQRTDEDLNQQHVYRGQNEDLDSLQKPRGQVRRPLNHENLSQKHVNHGRNENLESFQKPRSQINRSPSHNRNTEWERENQDLSQQHVDYGRNEDYESLQKPRSQTLDSRNRRAQTPRLRNLETRADETQREDEERDGNQQQVQLAKNEFTVEESGLYDNPRRNSESNQEQINNNQEAVQPDQKVHIVSMGDETLDNSGFNDEVQVTEDPQRIIPVTTPKPVEQQQNNEERTLENSGFFDSADVNQNTGYDQRQNEHFNTGTNGHEQQATRQHENEHFNTYNNGQRAEPERENERFDTHNNSQQAEHGDENESLDTYNNGEQGQHEQHGNEQSNTHNNNQQVEHEPNENENFNARNHDQRVEHRGVNEYPNTYNNGQQGQHEQRENEQFNSRNNGQRGEHEPNENEHFNARNNGQRGEHEQHGNEHINSHNNGQHHEPRENEHFNARNNGQRGEHEQHENENLNTHNNFQRVDHEQHRNEHINARNNGQRGEHEQRENEHFNARNNGQQVDHEPREHEHLNTNNNDQQVEHEQHENEDNLTQQTIGQANYGRENQSGRSSQFERTDNRYDDLQQRRPSSRTHFEQGRRNEHPTGRYIGTISQQHEQVSPDFQEVDQNQYGRRVENTEGYRDSSTSKPDFRISRPSYVNHIPIQSKPVEDIPKDVAIVDISDSLGNDNTEQPTNNQGNGYERYPGPHRGDISGFSPTSAPPTLPPVVHTTFAPTLPPPTAAPPAVVYPKPPKIVSTPAPPIYTPKCYGNQPISICNANYKWHFNRTVEYNNQWNINHQVTQNSDYFNQGNFGVGQQIQNPLETVQLTPGYGSGYKYHHEQINKYKFQQGMNTQNPNLGQYNQGCVFNCATQLPALNQQSYYQQSQQPSFENYSNSRYSQRQSRIAGTRQTTIDDIAQSVIPLGGTRPVSMWTESEHITTPRTFGQRTGQKLSQSYEGVRPIYG